MKYNAQIRKILKRSGFSPRKYKQSLAMFVGCADAIASAFGWWAPHKSGMSQPELYKWMRHVHEVCMSKKPTVMTCGQFFRNACLKAQAYRPKPKTPHLPPPRSHSRRRRMMRGYVAI